MSPVESDLNVMLQTRTWCYSDKTHEIHNKHLIGNWRASFIKIARKIMCKIIYTQ